MERSRDDNRPTSPRQLGQPHQPACPADWAAISVERGVWVRMYPVHRVVSHRRARVRPPHRPVAATRPTRCGRRASECSLV